MERFNWEPIVLQSKEGLALLNGTQFMSAYGAHILMKANKFSYLADLIGTISLEGFDGRIEPFDVDNTLYVLTKDKSLRLVV
jgi:histidine ammonia-lyase